jgi:hypothetical protein
VSQREPRSAGWPFLSNSSAALSSTRHCCHSLNSILLRSLIQHLIPLMLILESRTWESNRESLAVYGNRVCYSPDMCILKDALFWPIDSIYAFLPHPYKITLALIPPISPHIRNEIFSTEPILNPLVPETSIKRTELPYLLRTCAFLLYVLLQRPTENGRSCVVQCFDKIYNPEY